MDRLGAEMGDILGTPTRLSLVRVSLEKLASVAEKHPNVYSDCKVDTLRGYGSTMNVVCVSPPTRLLET